MTSSTLSVFDKYQVVRRIAVGGMGEVFLAKQTGLPGFERQVILKSLIAAEGEPPPQMVSRFLDEARVAASLNHPNVVSVFEAGVWHGTFFIAMEYIPGWNLSQLARDLVVAETALPPPLGAAIVHDAALGLDHAHHAADSSGQPLGIVHRDVSPQNIMVRRDGITKVVDFGVAWALSRESKTKTGSIVGKLAYMSPEQLRGDGIDATCDQFALGVVLWELITGQRLFGGGSEADVAKAVLTKRVPHPSDVRPEIPRPLGDVAMRMLSEVKARRYPRCADVAQALNPFAREPDSGPIAVKALLETLGPVPAERDVVLGQDFVVHLKSSDFQELKAGTSARLTTPDRPKSSPASTLADSTEVTAHEPAKPRRPWLAAVGAFAAVVIGGGGWALWPTRPAPLPVALPPVAHLEPAAAVPDAAVEIAVAAAPVVDEPKTPAPTPRPKARKAATPAPAPVAAAPTAAEPSFLTVGTRPWTTVVLDGKSLGSTPLYKVSIPAGRHTLLLHNDDEGIRQTSVIDVRPGETKKLDLTLKPK